MRQVTQWAVAVSIVVVMGAQGAPVEEGMDGVGRNVGQPPSAGTGTAGEGACATQTPRAVEDLIAALRDGEWSVREGAARALGRIRDRRAVKPLVAALKDDPSWSVKQAAAESLGRIGDPEAAGPLVEALKASDWLLRLAAIKALGEIGDGRAVEPLIAMLEGKEDYFHPAAAEALGRIRDPRSLKALIAALKHTDPAVRRIAAQSLGAIKGPGAVEPLLAALRDKSEEVRAAAACALGYVRDKRAAAPLTAALRDADAGVRRAAAVALGQIQDPAAVESLIAALGDQDEAVRLDAAEALAEIGDPRVVEPLMAVVSREQRAIADPTACALATIGDRRALQAMRGILRDHSDYLQACLHAARVVGRSKDAEAVDSLLAVATRGGEFWYWETRVVAAEALAHMGSTRAVERLIARMVKTDPAARQYAAVALGVIRDPRAIEPLVAALKDAQDQVRWAAALALGQFDEERIVGPLMAALDDGSSSVRLEAARALGGLKDGPPQRIDALAARLKDDDERVRAAAAEALAAIGDPRAAQFLEAALGDRVWAVRDAAARALKAITGRDPLRQEPATVRPREETAQGLVGPLQIEQARQAGVSPAIEVQLAEGVAMKMVFIPPGEFTMGDRTVVPNPPRGVTLTKGFYMAVFPVTVGQFRCFAAETGYRTEAERDVMYRGAVTARGSGGGVDRYAQVSWRSPGFEQDDSHPVVCVSWHDASAFCRWLSRKTGETCCLPTEAQWEYACRAGRSNAQSRYPWGAEWPPPHRAGNFCDEQYKAFFPDRKWSWYRYGYQDEYTFTSPVGTYPANPFRLYDMGGNVNQWCSDRYGTGPFAEDARNPRGPATGVFRAVRGSSWFTYETVVLQSAFRHGAWPWDRTADRGFRPVLLVPFYERKGTADERR